jgi:tRNA(fMet)-specific endonuclease VapC
VDLLIDSSVIIAGERGDTALGRLTSDAASVAISAVTVAELWKGVERADSSARRSRRAALCERVLKQVDVLDLDTDAALVLARLWADLERVGTPLAAFDLVIAATALAHGRALATFDRDFAVVPDLELIALGAG